MALRTEDVPLFPSRDFAFLTDDEAADWRVVVWRPTVVVLSDDGVCRADEDALCLVDDEDALCLVDDEDALCLVDDEVFREVEELLLADDEDCLGVDEDCLTDDEDCLDVDEDCLADDEDCLGVDEDCLTDDDDCLAVDEDCFAVDDDCLSEEDERLADEEDCLADEEDCLADEEDCLSDDEDVDVRRLWAYPSVWNAASAMSIAATAARYVLIKIVFAETYMPETLCSMVIHSVHRLSVEPIFL